MRSGIWNDNAFEYANELRLQDYLSQSDNSVGYLERCKVCGNEIHGEFVSVSGGCHVCEECVEDEMSENGHSRYEAIERLTVLCNTIFKSFVLPMYWNAYLIDESDSVDVVPEALKFLNANCPKGYYLNNITAYGIEGNNGNMRYYFSWRKMVIN